MARRHTYTNLQQFSWNKVTRTLTAEASELELTFAHADEISVKSDKTGRLMTFQYSRENRFDGEVVSWTYTSRETDIKVLIIND